MGRKMMSKEYKKTKQRVWNQKYLSNPGALARAREGNRLRSQERRRGEWVTYLGPRALLANTATQTQIMRCVSGDEDEEDEEDEKQCSEIGKLATSALKQSEE